MSEYLRRAHLEKEGAAFVGNFKNSGPRENICFYLILINHQSLRAHAEHHICTADILSTNQIYTKDVHCSCPVMGSGGM